MLESEDLSGIQIPACWEEIDLASLRGVVMIAGEADTGKTTFAKYLFARLTQSRKTASIAYLDGDPGQSSLGPPTSLTVALNRPGGMSSPEELKIRRYFAGSTSPRGHFLEMVVGAARLWDFARQAGASTMVHDTSGLISERAGGIALKKALIELLEPHCLFAIQRAGELEPILVPLRKSGRVPIRELSPSPAVRRRDTNRRRKRRSEQFRRYFEQAQYHRIDWARFGIFPGPQFTPHRLIAFEDREGYLLGLGIVTGSGPGKREIQVLTCLDRFDLVTGIHLGDMSLDPISFIEGAVRPGLEEGNK